MYRYEDKTDAELVELSLDGDADAFEQIVIRCQRLVFAAVREIVSDAFAVEDIAQDTFVFAFVNMNTLRERDKLRPWLAGTARRKALHYVTRRQRYEDIESAEGKSSQDDDPEMSFLRHEKRCEIRDAVFELPEKLRQAAVMFYFHDMKVADIARSLSVPQGTVTRRLHDARAKLKERLRYMNENIKNVNPAVFAAEVRKRLTEIQTYYVENGFKEDDRFNKMYSDAEEYIKTASDENEQKSALADLYTFWGLFPDKVEEGQRLAKESGNGVVIAGKMIHDLFKIDDASERLRVIDEEMLPEMERLGCDEGKGELLFWRTRALLHLRRPLDEIEQTFAEAARLIPPENVYQACAVCGLRTVAFARENASDPYLGFYVISEQYRVSGGKLLFISEPGFNLELVAPAAHQWDAVTYYASRIGGLFYDMSMKCGDIKTTEDGDTFLLVSNDEYVSVPAGRFAKCMHISVRFAGNKGYLPDAADVWYADGAGIVKAVFSNDSHSETYELSEYEIKGGEGPFPLAVGNTWRYLNPSLPEYTASLLEWYVTWTDGVTANLSIAQSVMKKKDFDEERDADGEYFIEKCDKLCEDAATNVEKVEEAIEALRAAVRKNTSERDTQTALGGIEYLERFTEYMKKYRLCPSSFNTFMWSKKDGRVTTNDNYYSFGPYRWGTYHIEDCIFGAKPYRYQERFLECIWDDKWVVGYHEEDAECQHPFRYAGEKETHRFTFDVEDGGTVTVGAGTFDDCLKLTIRYGTLDDVPKEAFACNGGSALGVKEYWLARGVGIVRIDCDFGRGMNTSLRLTSFKNPAHEDGYFPLAVGCEWEYDEETLTSNGYCAKVRTKIPCGHSGKFMIAQAQEFFYRGSDEEYDAFIKSLGDKYLY